MRVPSVCLTGVDTEFENGNLRVMLAVCSNGAYTVQLMLKNTTPEGAVRYAVVERTLEVGSSTVGMDVPLLEGGSHTISGVLSARYTDDGEFSKVIEIAPMDIAVPYTFKGLVVDSATLTVVDDAVEVYTALRRTSEDAPTSVTMLVRDTTLGVVSTVTKELHPTEITVVGLRAELEAGVHTFVTSIATEVDGDLTEVLPVSPVRV